MCTTASAGSVVYSPTRNPVRSNTSTVTRTNSLRSAWAARSSLAVAASSKALGSGWSWRGRSPLNIGTRTGARPAPLVDADEEHPQCAKPVRHRRGGHPRLVLPRARRNRPVNTLPLSVRICSGTPCSASACRSASHTGPAVARAHDAGAHHEPGVVVDAGDHLHLAAVREVHRRPSRPSATTPSPGRAPTAGSPTACGAAAAGQQPLRTNAR